MGTMIMAWKSFFCWAKIVYCPSIYIWFHQFFILHFNHINWDANFEKRSGFHFSVVCSIIHNSWWLQAAIGLGYQQISLFFILLMWSSYYVFIRIFFILYCQEKWSLSLEKWRLYQKSLILTVTRVQPHNNICFLSCSWS